MISSYIIGGVGDLRSLILMSIIVLWAVRLGTFLFTEYIDQAEIKDLLKLKSHFLVLC